MPLISIVLLTALVLNLVVGLFVFLGRARSASNYDYFALVIFVSLWILMNFSVEFVSTYQQAWWLATVAYASILGIAYAFLSLCYHFPRKTFAWPRVAMWLVLLITVLVGALVFIPGFMVVSVVIFPWKINTGPGLGLLFGYFIALVVAGFSILIGKLRRSSLTPQERAQLKLVLIGTSLAVVLGSIFNLAIPYMAQNYEYVCIGPIFTLIMVACIAVAIVRYHLFNLKVVAAQTFSVLLCGFLFIRTLAANTFSEQLINGGLLVATLVVCVFLVRSALKEVEQREALAVANENQKNLIHVMNHQIKGRLGAGKNIFAELLTDDYGVVPDTAKGLIKRGLEEMDTGVSYIQTILQGMSAETGSLVYDLQPMDFAYLVAQVVVALRAKAEAKGLSLDLECHEHNYPIVGDAVQLKEAVRNLIDNAITYTVHGRVTVGLRRAGDTVVLSVKDTGIGIPESDRPRLFTAGGRGKNSAKVNVDSTGYGLVFVKGVIEAHKGRVWYESDGMPGHGTTFFVEIPVDQSEDKQQSAPAPELVEAKPAKNPPASRTTLVVD